MDKLCADLEVLLNAELTIFETFFFASMIHLVFYQFHQIAVRSGAAIFT